MNRELDYFGALRRNWIVVIAVLGAALIASAIVTTLQKPTWESSTQLIVAPAPAALDATDVIRSVETLDRRTIVATFARIPSAAKVQRTAVDMAGVPADRAGDYTAHGSVVPSTNIIRIDVQGPDPRVAAAVADAVAGLTARDAQALYRVYSLSVLTPANIPPSPLYPDPGRNFMIAAALGIFLGIIAALAVERLRQPAARGEAP